MAEFIVVNESNQIHGSTPASPEPESVRLPWGNYRVHRNVVPFCVFLEDTVGRKFLVSEEEYEKACQA